VEPGLTCRDFVDFLDRYLSGELPVETLALFNDHLARCPACSAYTKTYRETLALARRAFARNDEPLSGVPDQLVRAILACTNPGRT
jgi:anti-sigma factor RsiW